MIEMVMVCWMGLRGFWSLAIKTGPGQRLQCSAIPNPPLTSSILGLCAAARSLIVAADSVNGLFAEKLHSLSPGARSLPSPDVLHEFEQDAMLISVAPVKKLPRLQVREERLRQAKVVLLLHVLTLLPRRPKWTTPRAKGWNGPTRRS